MDLLTVNVANPGTPFHDAAMVVVPADNPVAMPLALTVATTALDEIHAACRAHGTAFFFKQWGGRNKKAAGRKIDGKIWNEYPRAPQINRAKTLAAE